MCIRDRSASFFVVAVVVGREVVVVAVGIVDAGILLPENYQNIIKIKKFGVTER